MEMRKIGNETEADRILNKDFVHEHLSGFVEVGPDRMCMPIYFEKYYEQIKKFKIRDDDVFICAFPKSGTRWCNEMVWLILNNLDYEKSKQIITDQRIPRLEQITFISVALPFFKSIDEIDEMASPRCIGTHLHWSLLPDDIVNNVKNPKIIVVLRSPQDVCLSYYYQKQSTEGCCNSFDLFCKMFLGERMPLGPYWKQVLSYWEQKSRPNVLFIKYKEMKENLPSVIKKIAEFLGKTLTNEHIDELTKYLSFDSMKNNESFNLSKLLKQYGITTNPYVRKGEIGGHKESMSEENQNSFQKKIKEVFDPIGLSFD